MINDTIYLDYNATTPVDGRVFKEMAPYFCEIFGNAASVDHRFGHVASVAVEKARSQVANLIGAAPEEIAFTSGATEADNLAVKGVARHYAYKGDHLITVDTEHRAILDSYVDLEGEGKRVTYLSVDKDGLIEAEDVDDAIDEDTVLVSVMTVNNETGVIQPIPAIGEVCRKRGVLFHTDAVQAIGRIPFNVNDMRVDLVSMSAHKMYGPKGVGALYMRRRNPRAQVTPMISGGGHEDGMRSGTLNVPGIVGFGAAAVLVSQALDEESQRIEELRRQFEGQLIARIPGTTLNGHSDYRAPGTSNLSFEGCTGEMLIRAFNHVAASTGSACTTAHVEPSHVLTAMGIDYNTATGAIRFSLGRFTTEQEVQQAIEYVTKIVNDMRIAPRE